MRPQLGPILSVLRAVANDQRLLTLAEISRLLPAAERGAALVTVPGRVVVIVVDLPPDGAPR